MGSQLTVLGAALMIAGILLLAFLLDQVVKRIRYRSSGDRRKSPPANPSGFLVILGLAIIAISQTCFWLSSEVKYFRPLRSDGVIGKVAIERQDNPVKALKITYVPMVGDSSGMPNSFYLSGDSWSLTGELIYFKLAHNYLGLPSRAFKTVEFNGRFQGRIPPGTSGAILKDNPLEGGSSSAFKAFRDSRWISWFASVDSFSVPFLKAESDETLEIKLGSDGVVSLLSTDEQAKAEE